MSLQPPLHRYDHLPDNSIRLLRLLPHQDEDAPIQCQLFNCALENSKGTRPYEALSYVWGSDHGSQSISIDGCYLPIGGNLFAALLHLRDPSIERILWIDAVCINQEDNMEKGHQVQSMAKIYAKATCVIVWLGKATPDIDQALEDIRIAGFAGFAADVDQAQKSKRITRFAADQAQKRKRITGFATKQTITPTKTENAIFKLLEAAWFRRIWVLQEVAAARHIVVRCGPAEIDGYAFFSGLSALKLPYEVYPGLQSLIMSVAYLANGAAFRSRCTTSQAGRFSLNICHLGQLVDMYHYHQASDDRDRIYALLGMSSDDPRTLGLLVDYNISWAKLFKQLVHSILGTVPVDTWDEKAVAVVRSKGSVLGIVNSVGADIDRNGKQLLIVNWNNLNYSEEHQSEWELETSAEPVEEGDVVCLLQGATLPTIIRIHNDYWNIIVIAAASPKHLQVSISDDKSEPSPLSTIFPHDFLLAWDWDLCLDESQRENDYEDLMEHLAPKSPQAGLQTDCEKITRLWNSGAAMRDAERRRWMGYWERSRGEENLRKAIKVLEHILRNMDSSALAGIGCDHRIRDDMKELQGIVDLILQGKGGWTPLCLAAEAGCEAVVRLLLATGNVDPNAQDVWHETPLLKAAKEGHERIVKLLINTGKVDVNATCFRKTPLMKAAENGHTSIVEFLLSTSGVEPDFGFDPKDTAFTALSLAVKNGHEAIVDLLLDVSQVPLDFKYGEIFKVDGSTLLSIAKERDYEGIVKLLQEAEDSQELKN